MPDKTHRITLQSVAEYYSGLTGEPIASAPPVANARAEAHPQPQPVKSKPPPVFGGGRGDRLAL